MTIKPFKDFVRINWFALVRFYNEDYTYRASAFAFTTLLALVPLLIVVFYIVALFPSAQTIISLGEKYIVDNFIPSAAQAIKPYFNSFIIQSLKLPAFSLAFLFLTTILLVHSIEEALNAILKAPRRKRGLKVLALTLHWIGFLLIPFILGWSIFLSSYLFLISWIVEGLAKYLHFLLRFIPVVLNTFIITILYVGVPNAKISWRDGLLAGFIVALLFELSRIGFALYIKAFPTYSLIYGAFAIIPIFLIWLYIFWCIILYGALIIDSMIRLRAKHKSSKKT